MPCRITAFLVVAAMLLIALLGSPDSAAVDRVKKIPLVEIEVRALSESEPRLRSLTLKADRPARLQFETGWDEIGDVRVELTGRADAAGDAGARTVRLQAVLTRPDGKPDRQDDEQRHEKGSNHFRSGFPSGTTGKV